MPARAIIPPIADNGTVHKSVVIAVNKMRGVINALTRRASIARDTGNYNWKLGITVADLPASVVVQSELDDAIAGVTHPIFDHYATVSSSHTDGTEDDLYSDSVTGSNKLTTAGMAISGEYGGSLVVHATATRRIKLYFAGTAIFDSGAIIVSATVAWKLSTLLIRVSGTTIRHLTTFFCEAAPQAMYSTVGELTGLTLSNANTLKITGAAAGVGAAAADINIYLAKVIWHPVAT